MTTPEEHIEIEKQQRLLAHLKSEQNLPLALLAGTGAALLGAVAWGAITVTTEYQIGWMAVGVGFLVGYAVRLGKGLDAVYSIIGAVLALAGCLLGNFLSLVGFIAKQEDINILSIFGMLDYAKVPSLMMEAASPMDLLFYGIAIYEGYRFSIRQITPEQLELARKSL